MEKDINVPKDSRANVILREGTTTIQQNAIQVVLVSDPIIFEGCSWQSIYQYRVRSKLSASTVDVTEDKKPATLTRTQSMATVAPKTRKNAFLARVNHPSASGIVSSIKHFVQSVLKTPASVLVREDSVMVREFLETTEEVILNHPLWKSCDTSQIEETREGLEKYVTLNLHAKLFGNREEDRKKDTEIHETLIKLSWISFSHMDINEKIAAETSSMQLACSGLAVTNMESETNQQLCRIEKNQQIQGP
mgnify:CR=1 FL=1